MTAPTLARDLAVDPALYELAERVQADLDACRETVVDLVGYGRGWYILGVDWSRRLFEVRRSGPPISVAWAAVRHA